MLFAEQNQSQLFPQFKRALYFAGSIPLNSSERSKFYEKQYNQELDRKEKINARLNLPLAISVALIGLLSYLIKSAPLELNSNWSYLFWLLFLSSITSIFFAFYYFRQCWFGHTDQLIPTADVIENYYVSLLNHYSKYPNSSKNIENEFKEFIKNSFMNYATTNATNNDKRSFKLYKTTVSLTFSLVFAFFSLIPHTLHNLNVNTENQTKDSLSMSNQKQPPPPPAAPGPRSVKGQVPPKNPQPKPTQR